MFQVFQLLMDSLFRSFNDNVRMNNFSELSGCVFSWLEEQCKPQLLQELMLNILQQVLEFASPGSNICYLPSKHGYLQILATSRENFLTIEPRAGGCKASMLATVLRCPGPGSV